MDGIELEILWSNLISIVSEQAKALQRIAFSPIVREAGDLANALFDRRGRMVAQAVTGTPGHINSLAAAGAHFVEAFPTQTLEAGRRADHQRSVALGRALLRHHRAGAGLPQRQAGRAIFGSTIHHTDIGGYGVGAGARDVHEEGLWIPMLKLYERGEPNKVLHDDHPPQRAHARTKCSAISPRRCRAASSPASASSALLDRQGYDDIEALSDEIISRSETATREAIRKLKAGTYHGESSFDVPGGDIITLKAAVTVDTDEGEITIDFTGSSGQSPYGINVVMNYTHAYSTFAIRSCLNPELPNNFGSLAPIKVTAPRRLHRQLQVSGAGERAPRRRHVCADADPQGALSRHPGSRAGGRLGRGMDDPDPGQGRQTASRSPRRCSTIPAAWARARPRPDRRPPAIRPASPRCRSRCWKPRCRSCSTRRSCASAPAAPARSRGGDGQIDRSGTCAPTATWLLNAVPSRTELGAGRPRRRRARRGRALPGQRQARERGAQAGDAGRRSRRARNARRRRLRQGRAAELLFRSCPRKRAPGAENWVPAFAGTSGQCNLLAALSARR